MRRLAITVLPTLAVLIALEVMKRIGALPVFIPGPSQVLTAVATRPGLVWDSLVPTVGTAVQGFGIAALITLVAAGIGTALQPLRSPIYGLGVVLHAIPVIATAPLLALSLGTGAQMHVVIVVLAAQFPLLVGAMQGLAAADVRQSEMLHALSATRWQVVRFLQIPSALPFLFAGAKVATPLALLGAVTAEWAGADRGLGALMLYALFSYDIVTVWIAVLTCCAAATLAYAGWSVLERVVLRWDRAPELMS